MKDDNKDSCFYCLIKLTNSNRTRDHLKPKSKGNTLIDNRVYCCKTCNQSKGSLTFKDWLVKIKKQNDYRTLVRKNYIIGTIHVMIEQYGFT